MLRRSLKLVSWKLINVNRYFFQEPFLRFSLHPNCLYVILQWPAHVIFKGKYRPLHFELEPGGRSDFHAGLRVRSRVVVGTGLYSESILAKAQARSQLRLRRITINGTEKNKLLMAHRAYQLPFHITSPFTVSVFDFCGLGSISF